MKNKDAQKTAVKKIKLIHANCLKQWFSLLNEISKASFFFYTIM